MYKYFIVFLTVLCLLSPVRSYADVAAQGDSASVNGASCTDIDFDDATPAAPGSSINIKWQKDTSKPCNSSAYIPYAAPLTVTGGNLTIAAVTVSRSMSLSSISVSNANAFVDTIDGTNFDYSNVRFVDAVTGSTWWTFQLPSNLASTPAWNLILTHKAVSGAGGNVSLFVECLDFATNVAFDSALTDLWGTSANPDEKAVSTSANTTITTISATNFDSTEAIGAGNFLVCLIQRQGADANDTINVDWLLLDVSVRFNEND